MVQVEPPQNGQYLVAAYLIAAAILIGYWAMLVRKARKSLSGKEKT
jgi:hypothetical protein